jgi:F-type H+-transporting ATPase subunit b
VQDLAGAELEAVMVRVFLENLNQNKWDFGHLSEDGAGQSATSLKLRSAFNLPPDLQDQLRSHIQDQIKNPVDLHFESDPNLLSGIEIVWESGYTAVWNLQRYLDTLQDELEQQMNGYLGAQTLAPDQVEA